MALTLGTLILPLGDETRYEADSYENTCKALCVSGGGTGVSGSESTSPVVRFSVWSTGVTDSVSGGRLIFRLAFDSGWKRDRA